MEWPIVSSDRDVQGVYENMRQDGVSHNLADMFAHQRGPSLNTDATFMSGFCNGNQFEDQPWVGDMYRKEAKAAGVNITGKVYKSSLADYPGDPTAWVSDRADVRRVCEEKGKACVGAVNYRPPAPISAPVDAPLASDIVGTKVSEILDGLPVADRQHVDTADLAEQVREAMSPHWAKQ